MTISITIRSVILAMRLRLILTRFLHSFAWVVMRETKIYGYRWLSLQRRRKAAM